MGNARKLAKLAVIFLAGVLIVVGTAASTRLDSLSNKAFQVKPGRYSLSVYKSSPDQEVFRISPLDDYSYQGLDKNRVMSGDTYLSSYNSTDDLLNLAQGFISNRKHIKWTVESTGKTKIEYDLSQGSENTVVIKRTLETEDDPYALGQSIVICQACIVVDEQNRIFFQQNLLTQEKLNLANNLKLVPVITRDTLLPSGTNTLTVYDKDFNKKFQVRVLANEAVFYDEQWRVLEIKSSLSDQKTVIQEVILD
ncbi:MAG: hypothetical protein Q7S60_05630 [bacterium]|nr:hypothetical protein [bacterium]